MSLQAFIARVNEINNWLEQFPPRDGGTTPVKLADAKLKDIPENAKPKSWQAEVLQNLELLDPPKTKGPEEQNCNYISNWQ
eukprot:4075107-Ditylum_brightwellii.AAC.1